ncbi:arabinogalactan oligomer/maltooligosaccharide transport system substrate-binding protein [Lysinibacter cavernae]|uniref:Arabinogalactan oligomer/maltooligosaccharide transport system substrate-binding protein n=1 Tax=Lysinibacter cavernae TaxID=1640652 RepID=A0A7X5R2Q4_9MICO|nr:arabinogalactan oligomer/maltooligosaccharide transport system substrate-binding protein [Lysinibacter cavernae]
MKPKRILAIGALVTSAALLLSGCSGSSDDKSADSGNGTTLTVWVDSDRLAVLKTAAEEYSKEQGVTIKLVDKSIETMKADFAREAPTGKGPDIIMGAHDWIGGYVADGIISPIELGDKASEFSDVAINAVTYDSKIYQVPYAVENIGILRNTELVPDATPATWDEMIAAGRATGKKYPFVVTQNGPEGDPYHVYPLQSSFGSSIFGLDDKGEYNPDDLTIGNAEGVAFANWLGTVGDVIQGDISGDVAKQAFLDGEAPFWLTGPWSVKEAQDAGIKLAVDPIPSAGGQEANPFAGVKGFYINSKSKNAVAANDFLVNFIATDKIQTALFEQGGVLPAMTSAADKAASDPTVEGFKNAGKNAIPMPSIPAMADVWTPWGIAEGDILTGADPTATWSKLATDIQAAIDESK